MFFANSDVNRTHCMRCTFEIQTMKLFTVAEVTFKGRLRSFSHQNSSFVSNYFTVVFDWKDCCCVMSATCSR